MGPVLEKVFDVLKYEPLKGISRLKSQNWQKKFIIFGLHVILEGDYEKNSLSPELRCRMWSILLS